MPAKGFKNLTIKEELYDKLRGMYQEAVNAKKTQAAFTTWVSDYILEKTEEDDVLRRYAPFLSYIGAYGNEVHIADYLENRIVEVEIHDQGIGKKILYCRYCERDDCLHVGFCFAIKEVNRVLIERGFKQPKVRMMKDVEEDEGEGETEEE